ncbi:MAG TPA: 4-hydroxybenzoate 3-monooxygenase [Steroidobacteraceae bacterium]|nr:4-hydroxybenzoate 3-monooxygenase [Steroidobacteraceae bacterium]
MSTTKTCIAIVGAGPSGLMLAQLLQRSGIDSVVIEHRSLEHVGSRIRAGLLEPGTVEMLAEAGVDQRLRREGLVHGGFEMVFDDHVHRIDLARLAGREVTVYGQTEIQADLVNAQTGATDVRYECGDVAIGGFDGTKPQVTFSWNGARHTVQADFIAGCDGYHGVCRASIPRSSIRSFERVYPFGWLGVLADVPPIGHELVYVNNARGFALCSMRSASRSRYYLQCPLDDRIEEWPDSRFWEELSERLPAGYRSRLVTGPALEKSIAPLRSFVAEPMRFGRLFLVGDAAHIVPPTGAKGLNLAASDVRILFRGLVDHYRSKRDTLLNEYSSTALLRVWKATRFSWWFTMLMHRFPDDEIGRKLQIAELDYIRGSEAACTSIAENYVGLPFPAGY